MCRHHAAALGIASILIGWHAAADAQAPAIPTPTEALGAMVRLFDDPEVTQRLKRARVVIGTCKHASKGAHEDEIACTYRLVSAAGSSETQANFYRVRGVWNMSPTEEDDLPFPDPKLRIE